LKTTKTHKCATGIFFGGKIEVIRQEKDGNWLVKCDLCQWRTSELKRRDAENKLSSHINIVHKKRVKGAKKQKTTISPDQMPPKMPSPIKGH
jgi:hypothetical protein